MNAQPQQQSSTAASRAPRARRVDVVLVSREDEFLIELGPVLEDRYRVHTVENLAAVGDAAAGAPCLALIDVACLDDAASIAQLHVRHRGTPAILVAADASAWESAVHGDVVAAVPRADLAGPRMAAALRAAEARLQAAAATATATAVADAAPHVPRRSAMPQLATVVALAVIGFAAAGWWTLHRARPVAMPATPGGRAGSSQAALAPAAAPAAATAPAPAPQSAFELLSAARVALHDQKLLPRDPPRGDSALELYTQVLVQEPRNDEAADGVRRLFAAGRPVIDNDIAAGKLDEAARLLGTFHAAGADPDTLRQLDAGLAAARPRWLLARAHDSIRTENLPLTQQLIEQFAATGGDPNSLADLRHELDARKTEIQLRTMAADVHAAIAAGALTEPAADSAVSRLQAMRNAGRTHPLTLTAQHDVQAALLARSQDAAHRGQFDLAQHALAAAADLGPSPEVSAAKRQLQSDLDQAAQRAAAVAAAARPPAAPANNAGAAPAAAEAARPVPPQILAARTATPLKVQYPPKAFQAGVSGYATVEFTLRPDGSAADAVVIDSRPRDTFNSAAINAVMAGRYETAGLAGGRPQRARIRLNFNPE